VAWAWSDKYLMNLVAISFSNTIFKASAFNGSFFFPVITPAPEPQFNFELFDRVS
jgi:hypothetical protein